MKHRNAFTLVELSIVLVILGLLVGGVLTGQSLIRAAELRSITTEKDKFITALNAFRDKYMAIPGDMANAYAYWGDACGTNSNAANTGCNGNGDGLVRFGGAENLKVWEHLSRAGLIEGTFDGIGSVEHISGIDAAANDKSNIPKSKFPQAYWSISTSPCELCGDGTPKLSNDDHLLLSLGIPDDGTYGFSDPVWLYPLPQLTNGDALNIDIKTDDGRSNTGNLRGSNYNGQCDDNGVDYYRLINQGADKNQQCVLTYNLD